MDGGMGGREHRAQQTAPELKKKKAPQPESWFVRYSHAGPRARIGTPPLLEYRVQGATTGTKATGARTSAHTRTHAHTHPRTQSHMLPGCNQGATNVQAQYNDTQGPFFVARSIVAARSTSTNDSGSCREFLSRAPAPAQGSSSQTVEPQSDDTRPAASAAASDAASASAAVSLPASLSASY